MNYNKSIIQNTLCASDDGARIDRLKHCLPPRTNDTTSSSRGELLCGVRCEDESPLEGSINWTDLEDLNNLVGNDASTDFSIGSTGMTGNMRRRVESMRRSASNMNAFGLSSTCADSRYDDVFKTKFIDRKKYES